MAATDAGLDHIADQTHKMATDMSKANQSAEGMGEAFKRAAFTVVGFNAAFHVIGEIIKRTTTWQNLTTALSRENLSRAGLMRREIDLTNEKNLLERTAMRTTGLAGEFQRARLEQVRDELATLQKQKVVAEEMLRVGHTALGLLIVYKAAALDLYLKTREFNQNLIEANSSFAHRQRLLRETLMTQAQLGISFGDITKAAAALVHYGLDTEKTFNENVRLVAQMEQGLGVSVNASSQLASIVERQLKGSFTDVAHVVAQIVEDTSLAGDEAVRLATAIGNAMGRLRPGMGAQGLPEVLKLVGRYEAALKEVGGAPGAFQQLLTSLTTPGGIVGAGALGVSPEFLATSRGVQDVMERFGKYGEMLVGQSQGFERQFRLQMLADVFNTTADSANQMLIAIKRANEQQVGQITVQERWRNQLHATNAGLSRLGNSLMALLQGAMYPLVVAVGYLVNKLADAVEWFLKSQDVVYGVSIALGIGFLALLGSLASLTRSLWAVVFGSSAATAALARYNAAQLAGAGGGRLGMLAGILPTKEWLTTIGMQLSWMRLHIVSGGGGLAGLTKGLSAALGNVATQGAGILRLPIFLISRGLAFLTSSLALWLLPLTYAAYKLNQIYQVNKQSREDQIAAQKIIITKQEALEANQRARLYAAARYGSPGDVMKIYESLAKDAATKFQEIADPTQRKAAQKAWLDEQVQKSQMDVLKATATGAMFQPLSERTPEQEKRENEMRNLSTKMLKVNEDQKTLLDQSAKRAQQNAQDQAVEDAKNRCILWRGTYNPLSLLRVASDYYSEFGSK